MTIEAAIIKQRQRRKSLGAAMTGWAAPKPRNRRKAITQADIAAAVNETLDSLDREFRRLELDFPKHAQAYDTARVIVKNARRKA